MPATARAGPGRSQECHLDLPSGWEGLHREQDLKWNLAAAHFKELVP